MKFLVVDPFPIYGRGISLILEDIFGPHISVTVVETRAEAERVLQEHDDLDAVLFDAACYETCFWAELSSLVKAAQDVPVLIVARRADQSSIQQAIEAGVKGYISDTTVPEMLKGVLEIVRAGGVFAPITTLDVPARSNRADVPENKHPAGLTNRESEILQALATGGSNKHLARALDLSEGTVKAHLKVVFRKLGVSNRTEAAIAARQLQMESSTAANNRSGA